LGVGDAAPEFEGPTADGSRVGLGAFRGRQNVVLYFYPKDDTRGCTLEACSFRDRLQSLRALWTEVVGVSVDTVDSHRAFSDKYHLNFPLVSDHDGRICRMYGVLGDDGEHARRTTFIIGKDGRIARVFRDVDATRHTHEVVEALKRLAV